MKYRLIIAILAAVALMASCAPKYTPDKAIASVDKANSHFPTPVAEWTRKHYPCITKASDTVVLSRDSIIYVDCPDLPQIVHEAGTTDTVYSTKTIRVPVHLPVQTQYITKYIEDSAKIKVMQAAIDGLNAELTATKNQLDTKTKQADEYRQERNKLRWILFVIIGIVIGLTVYKVSKSFRPKISI